MINWSLEQKRFDLIYNWKISRNESIQKELSFISVSDGNTTGIGECSPNVRYGENPELIRSQFQVLHKEGLDKIHSLEDLTLLLNSLDVCNSLRFALESAYIHYHCKKQSISVHTFLGIPAPRSIFTSYTIPIMEVSEVKNFIEKHNLNRFKSLKIKIGSEGYDLVKECSKHYQGPLMIDANEAWKDVDALIKFMKMLRPLPIEFIEQPMPYNQVEEYIYLKKISPFPIIGDESITNKPDFESLEKQFHGVNMKLMKAGGYINGRNILVEARKRGLKTMIGCMIETTLGISSAMHLCGLTDYADLDGFFVIDNEPYQLIHEKNGELTFAV